jgi:predicted nucleic acid-binding protein
MKYFIDTNFVIDVFERKNSDSIDKFSSILENDGEFFYNGLVYAETLRAVLNEEMFSELKSAFDNFEWLEITRSIYIDAKRFSRYCRSKNIKATKGRCELIDFIHFVTAKHNNLEMLARDSDMIKLEQAWNDFISE